MVQNINGDKNIILIGLDGATWDLIKPWVNEGKLPSFKRLMDYGSYDVLKSTIPPLSPAAWTSIFTGLKPTKHTIWSFLKPKKNSYYMRPITSKDIKGKPLWEVLSENNVRSVFINIPFFYPPSKLNGILTTGLGTPSKNSNFAYPPSVKNEILKMFPDYDVDFNEDKILMSKEKNFIIDKIHRVTDAHINAFKYYYEKEKNSAKVFSVVLRSLDAVQHFFFDNDEIIYKFYKQSDKFLDWCIKNKKENDILLVCSDHGFRRVDRRIYLNEWLKKNELLKVRSDNRKFVKKLLPSVESLHRFLMFLGLRNIIWKIKRSRYTDIITKLFASNAFSYVDYIDWNNTMAYYEEASFGVININLKSREPKGIIPEHMLNEVREKIIDTLYNLKDLDTGKKVFEFVKKGEEIYGDSVTYHDIVFYPKKRYALSGGFSRFSKIIIKEEEKKGDHDINGIVLLYINNNKLYKIDNLNVWDIGCIILNMIQLSIPDEYDGGYKKLLDNLSI
ncbi:MAG: alkaline phosphatase family protein [Promethearchaeota archaeon]